MKKLVLAVIVLAALCAVPETASAQPPAFYGYYAAPYYPPSFNGFSYYASPSGYRSYNTFGYNYTPFGWNTYNYGAVRTRVITNAPYHSIYVDPFGSARMGTGYLNTPTFYQYYRFGY
jgi:hypothetical protein